MDKKDLSEIVQCNQDNAQLKDSFKIDSFKELTFGEKLVGLRFNPSGDVKVTRAKQLCAELADIINEKREDSVENGTYTALRQLFTEHTLGEILNAQMNVVKVLTFQN